MFIYSFRLEIVSVLELLFFVLVGKVDYKDVRFVFLSSFRIEVSLCVKIILVNKSPLEEWITLPSYHGGRSLSSSPMLLVLLTTELVGGSKPRESFVSLSSVSNGLH